MHVALLNEAINFAVKRQDKHKAYFLGAIGFRADGTKVMARNEAVAGCVFPQAHAEIRTLRKLDKNAEVVYVARWSMGRQEWANSKPCPNCRRALKNKGVKKVIYTTGPGTYQSEWLQ